MPSDSISKSKDVSAIWAWIQDKMVRTNWNTRKINYNTLWDYYRGMHWERESSDYRDRFLWRVTYNELKTALDEHIAHMERNKPRHYHLNMNEGITEQRTLNQFLVRATRKKMDMARREAMFYGGVYGAAIREIGINPNAKPVGLITGTTLPMPVYFSAPPWQWVIDDGGDGKLGGARWAIKFYVLPQETCDQVAKRKVDGIGYAWCSEVQNQFVGRTSTSKSERSTLLGDTEAMDSVLCADIWFNNVAIGDKEKPRIKAKSGWRLIRIWGDSVVYLGESPYGDEVGIPIEIYTPDPRPGFLIGGSYVQQAMQIQQDINALRATIREVEMYQRGLMVVRGNNAEKAASQIRAGLTHGVVAVPQGAIAEHIRGEKADGAMYAQLSSAKSEFQRLLGVPPVLSGYNETGSYSGEQTQMLQAMAGVMLGWKSNQYNITEAALGEKEWKMLKHFWRGRELILDDGMEAAYINDNVLNHRGWFSETLPEDAYSRETQIAKANIAQMFPANMVDPKTFYDSLSFLTDEQRERSLQYFAMMQAAALESAVPGGQGNGPSKSAK